MKGCIRVFSVGLSCWLISFAASTQISLILLVIGDNPGYGYYAAAPMFDMALEATSRRYPEIFRNVTHQILYKYTPDFSCGTAANLMLDLSGNLLAHIDPDQSFPVLIAPGCSLEIIPLGDVARELNVPLLTTTATDSKLDNRQRYPTLSSISANGLGSTAYAIRQFMRINSWKIVTVLCDALSTLLSASAYYGVLCRTITSLLTQNFGEFQMFQEMFDSKGQAPTDYTGMLRRAKLQCRIIIIATNTDVFKHFLEIAQPMGMTNGDYVFIYPESITFPETMRLGWLETDGDVVFQAFSSVIMFRTPHPDWVALENFTDSVGKRAKDHYNYTFAPDQYGNDITLGIYDAVQILAQVFSGIWGNISMSELNGKMFSDQIAGRTFDVGYRNVTMLPNGDRYRDTAIYRFRPETKVFETTWWHTWLTNSISVLEPDLAYNWSGSRGLPPDTPLCGFRDELCVWTGKNSNLSIATGAVVGAIVLALLAGCSIGRHRLQVEHDTWWRLAGEIGRHVPRTVSRASRAVLAKIPGVGSQTSMW